MKAWRPSSFKHDDKWFKISVKVEELAIDKVQINQEIE